MATPATGRPARVGHLCENTPALRPNHLAVLNTIPRDKTYAKGPLEHLFFTIVGSSVTRARTGAAVTALGGHAGQPGPSPPPLRGRCSHRCGREAVGGEEMNGDASRSSLCANGQPATAVTPFSRAPPPERKYGQQRSIRVSPRSYTKWWCSRRLP